MEKYFAEVKTEIGSTNSTLNQILQVVTGSSQPVGLISDGEYVKHKHYLASKGFEETIGDTATFEKFCDELKKKEFYDAAVSRQILCIF
jgi:hypothetical protein